MVSWFTVLKSTNQIIGNASAPNATEPPTETTSRYFPEIDATHMAALSDIRVALAGDGRETTVLWDDVAKEPIAPTDTRPYVDVTADKTEIDADGVDEAIITFTVLRPDGTPNTTFTATRRFKTPPGILGDRQRNIRLSFTNGVATKSLKTTKSGDYTVKSNYLFKVKTPVTVSAYE